MDFKFIVIKFIEINFICTVAVLFGVWLIPQSVLLQSICFLYLAINISGLIGLIIRLKYEKKEGQQMEPLHPIAEAFYDAKEKLGSVSKMVVAVKLPTGATELIINSEQIHSKVEYYRNAYDKELNLKANPSIQIVGYLFA